MCPLAGTQACVCVCGVGGEKGEGAHRNSGTCRRVGWLTRGASLRVCPARWRGAITQVERVWVKDTRNTHHTGTHAHTREEEAERKHD